MTHVSVHKLERRDEPFGTNTNRGTEKDIWHHSLGFRTCLRSKGPYTMKYWWSLFSGKVDCRRIFLTQRPFNFLPVTSHFHLSTTLRSNHGVSIKRRGLHRLCLTPDLSADESSRPTPPVSRRSSTGPSRGGRSHSRWRGYRLWSVLDEKEFYVGV